MMPAAQAQAGVVPLAASRLGDVLDGGVDIEPAHEQAAQAAAVLLDYLEPAAILWTDRLGFTDHAAGPKQ